MKEIFLLKLGEIVLKGANKRQFESRLRQNVRRRMKLYGNFDVYLMQSTIYVEPMDDMADVDGAWEACRSIFGVVSLCRCRPCDKNLDAIFEAVENYLGEELDCAKSFKVESKRSDKRFPLTSIQLSQEIGGRIAEAHPDVEVDVHHPDYTVFVEVRDLAAYVHGPAVPGAGGLPTGVGGRAMVLLSGGIDSPVAAYMIAKRGVEIEATHFFSYPYTSQLAKDKVVELARLVTKYSGRMTVNIVSFTEIQEAIRDNCPEEFFTLIMRRFMMEISQRIAKNDGCGANTFMDELAQICGVTNIFADVEGWVEVSEEQVLSRNPDYIVTTTMYFGEGPTPVEEILSRASWASVNAVAQGKVFNADSNEATRPGPRLKDAAEALYQFFNGTEE